MTRQPVTPHEAVSPDEIVPGVFVATSPVYLTTTTIVAGRDGGCLVIDPALTARELAGLGEWLAFRGLHPVAGWATHAHWDHVLWAASLGPEVPRYATAKTVEAAARRRDAMIAEVTAEAPGHALELFGRLRALRGPVIPWDGPTALVVSHDAHAPGHGGIVLPQEGVLVVGDMLSDVEIPLPDLESADPFGTYRAGLGVLARLPRIRLVVPGHGHVGDASAVRTRVAADFAYLDAIESGRDITDPRLLPADAGWLRAEHARHLEAARAQSA
jgi:glyoxylase-like metal-dependent hydrolase (beta-lactamase superfamily II)